MEKQCRGCGQRLPYDQFYRRSRSPDGRQARCIACTRADLDQADAARKADGRRGRAGRQGAVLHRRNGSAALEAAPLPQIVADLDDLERVLQARAADVTEVLSEAAGAGDPFVLARLADRLPHPCPRGADGYVPDDYDGPDCLLHDLAAMHAGVMQDRLPDIAPTLEALYLGTPPPA